MKPIVTVTLNPCIDGACSTQQVRHTHKTRTSNSRYDPGGGGINVARVISELGGPTTPVYLSGGATGSLLDELLEPYPFAERRSIHIGDHTRISTAVYDETEKVEYRFVPEGPLVTQQEWETCLTTIDALEFDWLVASGSRPRDFPNFCYSQLGARAHHKGARFVLDSSGPALASALNMGGVFLAKPSLGEFMALTGTENGDRKSIEDAAHRLIGTGRVRMLAVTLGHDGAMLATDDGAFWSKPPDVPVNSAVGAGDSFLGAMVYALARGETPREAFLLGMAAGTAAVMTPGTELCRRGDVMKLRAQLGAADPA